MKAVPLPERSIKSATKLHNTLLSWERKRREIESFYVANPGSRSLWCQAIQFPAVSDARRFQAKRKRMAETFGYDPWDNERYEVVVRGRNVYVRLADGVRPDDTWVTNMDPRLTEANKKFKALKG